MHSTLTVYPTAASVFWPPVLDSVWRLASSHLPLRAWNEIFKGTLWMLGTQLSMAFSGSWTPNFLRLSLQIPTLVPNQKPTEIRKWGHVGTSVICINLAFSSSMNFWHLGLDPLSTEINWKTPLDFSRLWIRPLEMRHRRKNTSFQR